MIFAFNEKRNFINVQFSGQIAICPCCGDKVVGKIYHDKKSHFAHRPDSICSIYKGGITDWHLEWQSLFDNTEVRFPEKGLRADVLLKNGTVIEFQHSDIAFDEIRRRENGYKRMVWVFDCTSVDDDRFTFRNGFYYWDYPKRNWLLFTKPSFFQFETNLILQFRDIEILQSENKGGYRMPVLKTNVWKKLTQKEFIQECILLDNLKVKDFQICENVNLKK